METLAADYNIVLSVLKGCLKKTFGFIDSFVCKRLCQLAILLNPSSKPRSSPLVSNKQSSKETSGEHNNAFFEYIQFFFEVFQVFKVNKIVYCIVFLGYGSYYSLHKPNIILL